MLSCKSNHKWIFAKPFYLIKAEYKWKVNCLKVPESSSVCLLLILKTPTNQPNKNPKQNPQKTTKQPQNPAARHPKKTNKKVYCVGRRFQEPLLLYPALLHDGNSTPAIFAKYNQTEECIGYDSSVLLVSSQSSKLLLAVFWEFRHDSSLNCTECELTL